MLAELHPRLPTMLEAAAGWVGRRRGACAAGALATVVAVAVAVATAHVGADVPLFDADLHPAQSAEVEQALTLWGEPFRANAQGTQILVAAQRRRDVLLRLTLAGLPRRYVPTTSDVLDDRSNALTPQSIVDDRRRAGIEGDLIAGLRRIAGVADASVVISPAPVDPFGPIADSEPASAAVQVVMQSGHQLPPATVAGIRRFVASAYPGLQPDRVTVVDGTGAAQDATPPPDRSATKERRVQDAVQTALDDVLGTDAAVVRVSVRSVGASSQTQTTRVIPRGALEQQTARERGSESGKTFDRERSARRYAYDTLTERRETAPDAQGRLSIAVFLNANRVDAKTGTAISALVRAAAGADLSAGDEVVVQAVPFAAAASAAPAIAAGQSAPARGFAPAIVACAIVLFGAASIPRAALRGRAETRESVRPTALDERTEAEARCAHRRLAGESPQAAAYAASSLDPAVCERFLDLCGRSRRTVIERYLEVHGQRARVD